MRMVIGYYTEDYPANCNPTVEYPANCIPWENFSPFHEAYFEKKVDPMVGDVIMSKDGECYEIVKRIFKMTYSGEPTLCLHLIMRKTEVEKLENL